MSIARSLPRHHPLLSAGAAVLMLGAVTGTARADDIANRERCIAKGNSPQACDCYTGEVSRRVEAGVKPETYRAMRGGEASKGSSSEDISAMGVLIQANVDAAKKCGVKLK